MRTICINQILNILMVWSRALDFVWKQLILGQDYSTKRHHQNIQNLINTNCSHCLKYHSMRFVALKYFPTHIIVYHCGVAKLVLFSLTFPTNVGAVVQTNINYWTTLNITITNTLKNVSNTFCYEMWCNLFYFGQYWSDKIRINTR